MYHSYCFYLYYWRLVCIKEFITTRCLIIDQNTVCVCVCVCKPFWYCKHGSTSRSLCRWGWWVFLPVSAGWAGSLPETFSRCSDRFLIQSRKNITKLSYLSTGNKEKNIERTEVFLAFCCFFASTRYRPCSAGQGQQLPALHPPFLCRFPFFYQREKELP